ncbi:MAG: hypothetical protein AUJ49_04050 [Desulfovibrionaceae bacterium CG1_02_65_16]|nr:MAG: hypothetical protein AUJ49_04050 [Desulfovibrionaceae bacterium CG1_02_65_16]
MSQCRLHMLTLPRDAEGKLPPIHPTLIHNGDDAVLVDPGCSGQLPALEAALRAAGMDPGRLTRVIITHHDHDHVGALAALKRACPGVQALASAGETPYIEGREKSLRLAQAEALFDALPEADKPAALASIRKLLAYDIERVVCHHGGVVEGNATPGGIRQALLTALAGAA